MHLAQELKLTFGNKNCIIKSNQRKQNNGSLIVQKINNDKILDNDLDVDIELAGKFIGNTDRILFNSKNEILYHPPKIKEVLFDKEGNEIKKQAPNEIIPNVKDQRLRRLKKLLLETQEEKIKFD